MSAFYINVIYTLINQGDIFFNKSVIVLNKKCKNVYTN